MKTRNVAILAGVAAALAVGAFVTTSTRTPGAPRLAGEPLTGKFDLEKVASIAIGDKVKLVAGENGWTIPTYQNYPADRAKIVENLMKLQTLKVGQVVRGKKLDKTTAVTITDAEGKQLAALALGPRHEKWGFGRYAAFRDQTVLVKETLDDFGDEPKTWVETKIVDEPWISFRELADPGLGADELGFATGVVHAVTINGNTNRVATIGNKVKGGDDRYLKLDGLDWVFVVPGYSVEKLLPKPPEPAKDDNAADQSEEPAPTEAPVKAEPPAAAEEPAKAETPAKAEEPAKVETPAKVEAPAKADA